MKRLVEGMLPSEVLLRQGIYLQSCAHLELALWHIVQLSDGHDLGEAPDYQRYITIKRGTQSLTKAVKAAISKIPVPLGIRVAAILNEVEGGREDRNMAAHGAWYLTAGGNLTVEYYVQRGIGTAQVWHFIDQTFSMKGIDIALDNVDRLLREAVNIRDVLRAIHLSRPGIPTLTVCRVCTAQMIHAALSRWD